MAHTVNDEHEHGEHDTDPHSRASPPGPTITDLVVAYRDRTGDSYATLSFRSKASGHQVAVPYLQRLGTGDVKGMPTSFPETVGGLAHALDDTQRAIVLAYARQLGADVGTTSLADRLPPNADDLPEHLQDAVIALVRTMLRGSAEPARPRTRDNAIAHVDHARGPNDNVYLGGRDTDQSVTGRKQTERHADG